SRRKMRFAGGEAGVFVREKVARIDDCKVVYAVLNILFYDGHIVLRGDGETTFVKPHAHGNLIFAEDDYGVQLGRFEAGSVQKSHFERGGRLGRNYLRDVARAHRVLHRGLFDSLYVLVAQGRINGRSGAA